MSDPNLFGSTGPLARSASSNHKLELFAKRFQAPLAVAYQANGFARIDDAHPKLQPFETGFFQSGDGQVLAYRRHAWQGPLAAGLFGLIVLLGYFVLSPHIELLPLLVLLLFIAFAVARYHDLVLVLNAGRGEVQWIRRGVFRRDQRTVPLQEWSGVEVRAMPSRPGTGPSYHLELVFRTEALRLDRGFAANWRAEVTVLRAWRMRYVEDCRSNSATPATSESASTSSTAGRRGPL